MVSDGFSWKVGAGKECVMQFRTSHGSKCGTRVGYGAGADDTAASAWKNPVAAAGKCSADERA